MGLRFDEEGDPKSNHRLKWQRGSTSSPLEVVPRWLLSLYLVFYDGIGSFFMTV